ncbi:unnamed protein product [Caenorhabditis brenneri]
MVADTESKEEFVDVDDLNLDNHEENQEHPEETYSMTDTIEKVIDVSDICIKIGQFIFKDIAQTLGNIAGVGGIVKAILALIPDGDAPDPVLQKLVDLEKKIDKLAAQMHAKFDDLKAFITEVNFYVEIMNPASNLMKYMMDCMKHPADEALNNFKEAYARHPPLELAYSMLSFMEQKSTNPLKMAMDADPLKTSTTFNKWYQIISGVLAEFLFLEAFGSGLLKKDKKDNKYNSNRIIERSEHLFEVMEKWKKEYTENNQYWAVLPDHMEKIMKETLSNEKKADKMKSILDTILTNDSFYLTVFNKPTDGYKNYAYSDWNSNNLIEFRDVGGSYSFIYRSKSANKIEETVLQDLKKGVKATKFDVKEFNKSPKDYPFKIAMDLKIASFVCIIGFIGEEIRWANCHQNEGQPGWSDLIISEPDKNGKRSMRHLIAGYQ